MIPSPRLNRVRPYLWIGGPILLLLLWLITAATKQGWFDQELTLRFSSETGSGLSVGMPVRVSGFRVGRLASMQLNDKGTVDGEIAIQEAQSAFFRQGSYLEIARDQLIGIAALDLRGFQSEGPLLARNSRIEIRQVAGMGDFGKQLADRVDPVLAQLTLTLQSLNSRLNDPSLVKAMGSTDVTLENLNNVMVETQLTLKETRGSVSSLEGNITQLTKELTVLSKELTQLSQRSGQLSTELTGLSKDVRSSWLIRGIFAGKPPEDPSKPANAPARNAPTKVSPTP
jgi:phospholipid/cholesterol/gamma-HCH transport system substrate-binding protein